MLSYLLPRAILCATIGLCAVTAVSAQHSLKQKAAAKIKPAVIQVLVDVPGKGTVPSGTGFLVNDQGYLITNSHVVPANSTNPRIAFYMNEAVSNSTVKHLTIIDAKSIRSCYEVDRDLTNDLVLLKLDVESLEQIRSMVQIADYHYKANKVRLSKKPVEDGEEIGMAGFPLDGKALIFAEGIVSNSLRPDGRFLANLPINPGNSGGPVYRVATGEVVGVAVALNFAVANQPIFDGEGKALGTREITYHSGISQVIGIEPVMALLRKNSVQLGKVKTPKAIVVPNLAKI